MGCSQFYKMYKPGSSLLMTMLTMGTLLEKHDFSEAPFGLVVVL